MSDDRLTDEAGWIFEPDLQDLFGAPSPTKCWPFGCLNG
jgi:hypothetical protein